MESKSKNRSLTDTCIKSTTSATVIQEYIQQTINLQNHSLSHIPNTRIVLSKIDVMTATQDDIITFLNHLKKPESEDSLHKSIGTYNNYLQIFKKFFKWFMVGLKQLRRKERSIYKPSDLWTQEDDMIFLKSCPSKRDKCYYMMG